MAAVGHSLCRRRAAFWTHIYAGESFVRSVWGYSYHIYFLRGNWKIRQTPVDAFAGPSRYFIPDGARNRTIGPHGPGHPPLSQGAHPEHLWRGGYTGKQRSRRLVGTSIRSFP